MAEKRWPIHGTGLLIANGMRWPTVVGSRWSIVDGKRWPIMAWRR